MLVYVARTKGWPIYYLTTILKLIIIKYAEAKVSAKATVLMFKLLDFIS